MADTGQAGDLLAYERGADGIVRGDAVMAQVPGVDGKALAEEYLTQGAALSTGKFAVTVSQGQAWVMGDNRVIAVDLHVD